jgi:hypothetical protein
MGKKLAASRKQTKPSMSLAGSIQQLKEHLHSSLPISELEDL